MDPLEIEEKFLDIMFRQWDMDEMRYQEAVQREAIAQEESHGDKWAPGWESQGPNADNYWETPPS